MALYVLGEGKLAVRLTFDHIDKVYRVIIGKHDGMPGVPGTPVNVDTYPLRHPAIFETKNKDQALDLAVSLAPGSRERFEASLK